jgi:hypothetical protein
MFDLAALDRLDQLVAGDDVGACYLRTSQIRALVGRLLTRMTIYSLTQTIF